MPKPGPRKNNVTPITVEQAVGRAVGAYSIIDLDTGRLVLNHVVQLPDYFPEWLLNVDRRPPRWRRVKVRIEVMEVIDKHDPDECRSGEPE